MKKKIIKRKQSPAVLNKGYTVIGVVQKGHGRGLAMGAQTANFDVSAAGALPPGLYQCEAAVGNACYKGLLYYGINSLTNRNCLEVHLLDYEGSDLYGTMVTVKTNRFIRSPKQFKNVGDLTRQIQQDVESVAKPKV